METTNINCENCINCIKEYDYTEGFIYTSCRLEKLYNEIIKDKNNCKNFKKGCENIIID